MKIGKNTACPCGSGKKYKNCCYKESDDKKIVSIQPAVENQGISKSFTAKLVKKIKKHTSNNIIPIDSKKFGKEIERDIKSLYSADKDEKQRVHTLYTEIQHRLSYFIEIVSHLPEFNEFYDIVTSTEDEYMPSYPPMSPITNSHFICWSSVDLRFSKDKITVGECYYEFYKEYGEDVDRLQLVDNFNKSSMRVYEITHSEKVNKFVWLKDIITQEEYKAYNPSGYTGKQTGELWLIRYLPPPFDIVDYGVLFTTPYVLIRRSKEMWLKSLNEYMSKTSISNPEEAYKFLMKYGLDNRFWNEFIMNTYFNFQSDAIFLGGLLHENFHK